ncbi:MAG: hypothetical protein J6T51_02505 [Kiritimatiellae bacterium]|nr:hypothetical protein [Kiritimatiellia bacterium]
MSASFVLLAAALLLRNPFWPIGYEGEREEISAEARVAAKAPPPPEPKEEVQTARSQQETRQREMERATSQNWIAARRTLRIGGTALAKQPDGTTKSSVFINGRDYMDNDLVSVNHNGRRFTWRVTGLTEKGTLKLERVRTRPIENSSPKGARK